MPAAPPVTIIVNPVAGPRHRGAAWRTRELKRVVAALSSRGFEASIVETTARGDARSLAANLAARGARTVVAWGGDGTVNEVASGLVGSATALAIVPVGSGNGLGRALGVPLDPVAATLLAFEGRVQAMDVGCAANRHFFNVAGVGIDAAIAHAFNVQGRESRGFVTYVRSTLRELWRYRPGRYVVQVDDTRHALDALLVAVANSPEYGNGARIAPDACVDDGWLDAVAVGARGPVADLWRARRLYTGSIARDPLVWRARGRRITIEHDGPILYHVDGDACDTSGRLDVEILPGALQVVRPAQGRSTA